MTVRLCEITVTHLAGGSGDVFLVGVAHVSNSSAQLVRDAVKSGRPDLVMVELDSERLGFKELDGQPPAAAPQKGPSRQSADAPLRDRSGDSLPSGHGLLLVEPTAAADAREQRARTAAAAVQLSPIEQLTSSFVAASGALAVAALRRLFEGFYSAASGYLNTTAGSEMNAALIGAYKEGVPVLLGDRPAKVTLARIMEEVGSADLGKLDSDLNQVAPEAGMRISSPQDVQALLEDFRDPSTTRKLRQAFKESAPGLFSALVSERDEYMANSLLEALRAGRCRIVAVIGSIHVQGIADRLTKSAGLRTVDGCIY